MASQPPTSARIEDLKARLRLDPKSRLFYPLAEDLRKAGRRDEAEKVLRAGLEHHGTYLSAWMSLGRVLVEKGEHREATDVLMRALALDPGNVVCARLLANSYLALGEKLEAVKKFKLVRALLPADEEVEEQIERLEKELEAGKAGTFPPPAPPPVMPSEPVHLEDRPAREEPPAAPPLAARSDDSGEAEPFAEAPPLPELAPPPSFGEGEAPATHDVFGEMAEPGLREPDRHWTNPFTGAGSSSEEAPESSSMPEPPVPPTIPTLEEPFSLAEEGGAAGAGSLDHEEPRPERARVEASGGAEETLATLTMADLYARQGHADLARDVYRRVLERDPGNEQVKEKLERLSAAAPARDDRRSESVERLQRWLGKVGRRDV